MATYKLSADVHLRGHLLSRDVYLWQSPSCNIDCLLKLYRRISNCQKNNYPTFTLGTPKVATSAEGRLQPLIAQVIPVQRPYLENLAATFTRGSPQVATLAEGLKTATPHS